MARETGLLKSIASNAMKDFMMRMRNQVTMDPDLLRRAKAKAAQLGLSFSEYVRRLITYDLDTPRGKADVSVMFDFCDSGEPTDVARDKDKLIGEAVWAEYLRKTGQKPRNR